MVGVINGLSFSDKKEFYIVKCPNCNKIDIHTPKGLIFKNNRINHKCKNKECQKQFILKNSENSIFVNNCNEIKRKILFGILDDNFVKNYGDFKDNFVKISKNAHFQIDKKKKPHSRNLLKRLNIKCSKETLYKNLNDLLETGIIRYSFISNNSFTSHFELNFYRTLVNYIVEITLPKKFTSIREYKKKIVQNIIRIKPILKPSIEINYPYLNQQITYHITNERENYKIKVYLELPELSFSRFAIVLKKLSYLLVKELKNRNLIKFYKKENNRIWKINRIVNINGISSKLEETIIINLDSDKSIIGYMFYWLNRYGFLEYNQMDEFGNLYRLLFKTELDLQSYNFHYFLVILNINRSDFKEGLKSILRNIKSILAGNIAIKGDYFTLSRHNRENIQFIICNNGNIKKCNLDLIISGFEELSKVLRSKGFLENRILELVKLLLRQSVSAEVGFKDSTPASLIHREFGFYKHRKAMLCTYWYDTSPRDDERPFEIDIRAKTNWFFLIDFLFYSFLLRKNNQFSNTNKNITKITDWS